MNCRACNSPCEPGKTIFCVACFESLPGSERANLRRHFLRVRQVCKNPAAFESGMRDKIAKCVELIKTARSLPPRSAFVPVVNHAPLNAAISETFSEISALSALKKS